MYFLDQPEEIIIEQIRYLPLQDLMSVCQTNPDISRICSKRRVWDLRLMDEFGTHHPTDPRSHYLLLDARRSLLNSILGVITQDVYDRTSYGFTMYFTNYQLFATVQTNIINQMSKEQIQNFNTFMNLVKRSRFADDTGGEYSHLIPVFDLGGSVIISEPNLRF